MMLVRSFFTGLKRVADELEIDHWGLFVIAMVWFVLGTLTSFAFPAIIGVSMWRLPEAFGWGGGTLIALLSWVLGMTYTAVMVVSIVTSIALVAGLYDSELVGEASAKGWVFILGITALICVSWFVTLSAGLANAMSFTDRPLDYVLIMAVVSGLLCALLLVAGRTKVLTEKMQDSLAHGSLLALVLKLEKKRVVTLYDALTVTQVRMIEATGSPGKWMLQPGWKLLGEPSASQVTNQAPWLEPYRADLASGPDGQIGLPITPDRRTAMTNRMMPGAQVGAMLTSEVVENVAAGQSSAAT